MVTVIEDEGRCPSGLPVGLGGVGEVESLDREGAEIGLDGLGSAVVSPGPAGVCIVRT